MAKGIQSNLVQQLKSTVTFHIFDLNHINFEQKGETKRKN